MSFKLTPGSGPVCSCEGESGDLFDAISDGALEL